MSLIRVRRERRDLGGFGPRTPPGLGKLLFFLLLVGALIWWMNQLAA